MREWAHALRHWQEVGGSKPAKRLKVSEVVVSKQCVAESGVEPPFMKGDEFTKTRYTACTSARPKFFTMDGYELRPKQVNRKIRSFITVTMYNEEYTELMGTLTGICENVKHMADVYDDENIWETMAVCVVSDGRTKASDETLDWAEKHGIFNAEQMAVASVGLDVQMHLFEFSCQLMGDLNYQAYYPPLQVQFALKEHNSGKLNSHLWFFDAFAEHLMPTYTILIDVGTIPTDDSIFRLIRSMDRDTQIGGVCGEIATYKPNMLNFVVASQHFEYKISNMMDKALESVCGYISVLPGAFSAYRYVAIRVDTDTGEGPLAAYFKSLTSSAQELGPFEGNMYLAEDRILCFELLSREGCNWTMHYVKDAEANTDIPETLLALIKQRRRWLNGSFFALLYSIINFPKFWTRSSHSLPRKITVSLQFAYFCSQVVLNWLLPGTFYLAFWFILHGSFPNTAFLDIMNYTYIILTTAQVVLGLGNKPDGVAIIYTFCMVLYGMLLYIAIFMTIYDFGGFGQQIVLGFSTFECKLDAFNAWFRHYQGAESTGCIDKSAPCWYPRNSTYAGFTDACPEMAFGVRLPGQKDSAPDLAIPQAYLPEPAGFCNPSLGLMYLLVIGSVGVFFLAGLLHGELSHVFKSILQ